MDLSINKSVKMGMLSIDNCTNQNGLTCDETRSEERRVFSYVCSDSAAVFNLIDAHLLSV